MKRYLFVVGDTIENYGDFPSLDEAKDFARNIALAGDSTTEIAVYERVATGEVKVEWDA